MSLADVSAFVNALSDDASSIWRMEDLRKVALAPPPDVFLPRNAAVIKGDIYTLWVRWFVEGLCNPLRYVDDDGKSIIDVIQDLLARLDAIFPGEPQDEREELANRLGRRVMAEVLRQRNTKRVDATRAEKHDLIDASTCGARCWLCGYLFTQLAIDRFLGRSRTALQPTSFVDILRPRGIHASDIRIEVEHVVPVTGGGGGSGNLALACGWCNRHKGPRVSIYDSDARPPRSSYMLGGYAWHELPNPFWTVRLLALRKRCEHPGGCPATAKTAELFIAPSHHHGAPNPSNLHIFCGGHDPYATTRFFARDKAKQIWDARLRAFA